MNVCLQTQVASGSGQGNSSFDASTQVEPAQQIAPPVHSVADGMHASTSQKQLAPSVQGPAGPPAGSGARHESPPQHSPPPKVQDCDALLHGDGGVQAPLTQVSPVAKLQQSTSAAQVWPVPAQLDVVWQVPRVEPGGMSQASPPQQSPSTVQVPAWPTQGATQTCASGSQAPEQHWLPDVQAFPFGAQSAQVPVAPPEVSGTQRPEQQLSAPTVQSTPPSSQENGVSQMPLSVQAVPSQHGSGVRPAHDPPRGTQEVAAQRRMPASSGTHGAPPQH